MWDFFSFSLFSLYYIFSFYFIFQIWNHCFRNGLFHLVFRTRYMQCGFIPVVCNCKNWDHLLIAWNSSIQITHFGIFYSILDDFDDEDLRFNDYENRLEDSFFKYVARTDDYDRNEVPWESHEPRKPVQVKMSAYLRYESTTYIFIIFMQQLKVSLLGVDSLWGDYTFIPADWGS